MSWFAEVIFIVICVGIGLVFGKIAADDRWKADLVERGYAQYDSKTGEWGWKE